MPVDLFQEHQILEIRRRFQFAAQPMTELAGTVVVSVHVVLNQEAGAVRNEPLESRQRRLDVIAFIEPFAQVVQQSR